MNVEDTNFGKAGPGRPKGSKDKRTILREVLQEHYQNLADEAGDTDPVDGEKSFWKAEVAFAAAGETQARTNLVKRLLPELKSVELKADVDVGRKHLSATELRERLIASIVDGDPGGAGIAALLAGVDAAGGSTDGGDQE